MELECFVRALIELLGEAAQVPHHVVHLAAGGRSWVPVVRPEESPEPVDDTADVRAGPHIVHPRLRHHLGPLSIVQPVLAWEEAAADRALPDRRGCR